MGEPVCDALAAELSLDRLDAELASELPHHVRAFARAHAAGAPPPPAPAVALRASSLASARDALAHPVLVERARALLRVLAPIAIETDSAVARARAAPPTWHGLAALAAARDAVARRLFACDHIELAHRLHRAAALDRIHDVPPVVAGWHDREAPLADGAVAAMWGQLAAQHGARANVQILASVDARPRTFVVGRGEVIVVVPRSIDTPVARFAALHELGHAVAAAIGLEDGPRSVDEGVAAYVARAIESSDHPWHTPLAVAARARRLALAVALDAIERARPAPDRPTERPPWSLWHDPGAQAAYVAAEQLAERWMTELGRSAATGALARALAASLRGR